MQVLHFSGCTPISETTGARNDWGNAGTDTATFLKPLGPRWSRALISSCPAEPFCVGFSCTESGFNLSQKNMTWKDFKAKIVKIGSSSARVYTEWTWARQEERSAENCLLCLVLVVFLQTSWLKKKRVFISISCIVFVKRYWGDLLVTHICCRSVVSKFYSNCCVWLH